MKLTFYPHKRTLKMDISPKTSVAEPGNFQKRISKRVLHRLSDSFQRIKENLGDRRDSRTSDRKLSDDGSVKSAYKGKRRLTWNRALDVINTEHRRTSRVLLGFGQQRKRKSKLKSLKPIDIAETEEPKRIPKERVNVLMRRWRRLTRMAMVFMRLYKYHSQRVKDVLQHFNSLDLLVNDVDINTDDENEPTEKDAVDMLRGLRIWKRGTEMTKELRHAFRKLPEHRTEEDIHLIRVFIRKLKNMENYPAEFQLEVAKRCWYEKYGRKRVIIREGDRPFYYYIILAGSAIVAVVDETRQNSKAVCMLSKGQGFGELSIMNQTLRFSSVISRETIELLCLDSLDYIDIFMGGGFGSSDVKFLNEISMFAQWPLEKLENNPRKVMASYFKSGAVMVPDSRTCEWIYIVKSGSVDIIMQMEAPVVNYKKSKIKAKKRKKSCTVEKELTTSQHKAYLDRLLHLKTCNTSYHLMLPDLNVECRSSYRRRKNHGASLRTKPETQRHSVDMTLHREGSFLRMLGQIKDGKPVNLNASGPFYTAKPMTPRPFMKGASKDIMNDEITNKIVIHDDGTIEGHRTLTTDMNMEFFKTGYVKTQSSLENPAFICIKTLDKGDVYGLAHDLFDDQPNTALVSRGAMCIMIKKTFYLEHACSVLISLLKECIIVPFKKRSEYENELQTKVSWDEFKVQQHENIRYNQGLKHCDTDDARSIIRFHRAFKQTSVT
ncbi:uncharacterized protein LOC141902317 [Tubulanus polymorphus]|uniref:uncharacterized protein LOC141902317 n=1 Tax=Tubulanus polymorphus TaxID=672921 RepID=UPI003DA2656A